MLKEWHIGTSSVNWRDVDKKVDGFVLHYYMTCGTSKTKKKILGSFVLYIFNGTHDFYDMFNLSTISKLSRLVTFYTGDKCVFLYFCLPRSSWLCVCILGGCILLVYKRSSSVLRLKVESFDWGKKDGIKCGSSCRYHEYLQESSVGRPSLDLLDPS